jgi:regulator of sirC expression with transglutaminase-like and TPR domain
MSMVNPLDQAPPGRLAFAELMRQPEESIALSDAALLIAKEEYPDLDVAAYRGRLERMAADVQRLVGGAGDSHRLLMGLNEYLFDRLGFRGNVEDYYDPKNNFLNEVLERRLGIPITLSVVYMDVGCRLGLMLRGVGMPGHFLVKYSGHDEELIIDPYGKGEILSETDCQRLLDQVFGGNVRFEAGMLNAIGTRQILRRMLTNLKAIYIKNQVYGKALATVERLLILEPDAVCEIRDRALILFQLKRHPEAGVELERYLRLQPSAPDSEVLRGHLRSLRQRAVALN